MTLMLGFKKSRSTKDHHLNRLSVVVDLLFGVLPNRCGGFCVCLCFVVHYFVSFLVLQSSLTVRESWLLCFYCLTGVLLL